MREATRRAKFAVIEEATYRLMAEKGFESTSMLNIAKASKSSNQTMYKWFGDKRGLFAEMVSANAMLVREELENALDAEQSGVEELSKVGYVLIDMLLGERAIALNRAAATDHSGELGRALAENGREHIVPILEALISRVMFRGIVTTRRLKEATEFFVTNLVGDLQIRRATGAIAEPTDDEKAARVDRAIAALMWYVED